MTSTILIIGGGQAGAQAVDTLRREGFVGHLKGGEPITADPKIGLKAAL